MSKSHIDKLRLELAKSKWVIHTDLSTNEFLKTWDISRPNGDCSLKLSFSVFGNTNHGDLLGNETMDNAIGCTIIGYPEIDLYFGKYTGQFQKDLILFISQINKL